VGPFALPLIWWRPKLSLAWKIGLTIVILVISYIFFMATMEALRTIREYYKLLDSL